MHALPTLTALLSLLSAGAAPAEPPALFSRGEGISLERAIPANERGILALTVDDKGRVFGGTTGRAAHLFVYDRDKGEVRSLARLEGGVGFAYGLVRLPDGSLVGGTQADPTGTAVRTDPKAVGHLYRFTPTEGGPARVEDLGVPVAGQGVYALAYVDRSGEVVGNTWPDGHFFTYDVKARRFHDHGAVAGYRTFETPPHAADVNRGTGRREAYSRQVSRAILVDPATGAYTGGADGRLYRYDPATHKLEKTDLHLPAAAGREPWASLDAAVVLPRSGVPDVLVGGTSDGYLFELSVPFRGRPELRPWGKALAEGAVQGLVPGAPGACGVGGGPEGMPRWFAFRPHGPAAGVYPGGIPRVDGQLSMGGFGALVADGKGNGYAGERDRIGRLVRYGARAKEPAKPAARPAAPSEAAPAEVPPRLPCHVVFAPEGTTTDGSGYTAIEVGKDSRVYVGAARYGDYAWLLRFDPAARPTFLDKVVSLRQLTGERRRGVHTQAKVHSKLLVGADGRVWFASKQGHEIFDTRPEYGEEGGGFPGGHLCYYDPATGFSRSLGILKRQEGLVGGALDDKRGRLYYRSEPKNHFLVYDIQSGEVRDRGNVGASCRYMAIDRGGAVWTVGRGATLCRYDPATDYVEDVAVKLEGPGSYDSPYVLALGPNGKLYGAGTAHPWLLEYDINTFRRGPSPEVTARNAAPAAPGGLPVHDVHAAVFGQDGKLYYPLNTSGPLEAGGKPQQYLRLMRFDPATRKSETVGVPQPVGLDLEKVRPTFPRQGDFRVYSMQGAAVGPDGSLYLLGIYPQLHVVGFPKLTAPRAAGPQRPPDALEGAVTVSDPGQLLLGPELVHDRDGSVRLAHSVLLADETGATDFRQGEPLSERVHARKVFHLDSADVTEAELLFYGSAKAVRANGAPLKGAGPLVSTGWSRVRVPVALLKAGANEFDFSGGGSLLIEPGRAPSRSFKSGDGGRTWSGRALGAKDNQEGEYLVRLRLGRYALRGRATSRVVDLWAAARYGQVPAPAKVLAFRGLAAALNGGQPEGTRVAPWLRTGSTPVPDEAHWTAWRPLDKDAEPGPQEAGHRWAQLAFDLTTTKPQASPRLRPYCFEFRWAADETVPDDGARLVERRPETNPERAVSPVPFAYQAPSPRLKLLRERYQLDKVIAPGKTEMEQLMLLRHWVRNQWHTAWGNHPAAWMPPWDALIILESKDQPDCLTMCTHYACVFTQCCLALGWNARHCILDHHCVAEVWVDQHRKWVMMDAGNSAERADVGLHFERDGVPLSARELHLAHRDGKADDIRVCFTPAKLAERIAPLCRPAPPPKVKPAPRPDSVPLAELKRYPVCQLNNYRRYAFPGRNDYLTSLLPGELYQGWSEYFYDGYWWVGDSPDAPAVSPEYSRHLAPARPQDIDWDVNWCRIHLARTGKPGELRVDVEPHVPNLARLERAAGDKEAWQATPAGFVWQLKPGANVLRVRGVNAWGRAGGEARVEVEWKGPAP
jgi:hypothetical protein